MIYLWVNGEGWKEFEVSDTEELKKRGIRIGDRAFIGDRVKPVIIYIVGSRFPVSYWGEDRVDIGCQSRSIDQWLEDYQDIAREHNFNIKEIEEYRGYVEFIKSVHRKTEAEK